MNQRVKNTHTHQPQEMQPTGLGLGSGEGVDQNWFGGQRLVRDGEIYGHQVLQETK